jgi:hypothetical protein
LSKTCQTSCQKVVKKLSKSCKKLSKSCQKVVKKVVKKLSKSCKKLPKVIMGWVGGEIVVPRPSASASLTGRRQKDVATSKLKHFIA